MKSAKIFIICLLSLSFAQPVSAVDVSATDVKRAIDRGITYLKREQKPDGRWTEYSAQEKCGATALVVLALVSCGATKDDPTVDSAMRYLRTMPAENAGQNYSLSLQTMVFSLVDPERDRMLIRRNVELLEKRQVTGNAKSPHHGGWGYGRSGDGDSTDLSNSQYSILALYEAERAGVFAKQTTWERAMQYWSKAQNNDGSWAYKPDSDGGGSGSMTSAGIASMIISSGVLSTGGAKVNGDNILCLPDTDRKEEKQIEDGLRWFAGKNIITENPGGGNSWYYYYLYALERVGRMTNRRFIGRYDWYREGTARLLNLRDPIEGYWMSSGESPVVSTAFALLFLSKGRRPVLLSKAQFGLASNWNAHPHDANNLTVYAERQWKNELAGKELTWQIVDLDRATVEDLLQTPVLYISGNQSPLPLDDAKLKELSAKLREYLNLGGFLFAEAQTNDKSFDKGFRELMQMTFPEPNYELQLLEASHPIWSAEVKIEPDAIRPIEGIHFGCRTRVVYVPPSVDPKTNRVRPALSCLWEVAKIFDRGPAYSATVQRQIDAGIGIGLNVLAYATDRDVKFKEEIITSVKKKIDEGGPRRGKIFVGVLEHGGGANNAPQAVPNLLQWGTDNLGFASDIRTEMVTAAGDELTGYPIMFMHGRKVFAFSQEERENLRKYIQNGGFLFINSLCSAKGFTDSVRDEIKAIFPDMPLELVPTDDSLFSGDHCGFKIDKLPLKLLQQVPGQKIVTREREVTPELYALRIENRIAVLFSPYDVSCALENASTLECQGYSREAAMKLATNILLYAIEYTP